MTPIEFIDVNGDRWEIKGNAEYVVIQRFGRKKLWFYIPKSSLPDLKRAIEKFEEQK